MWCVVRKMYLKKIKIYLIILLKENSNFITVNIEKMFLLYFRINLVQKNIIFLINNLSVIQIN